jgi:ABC-type multidrug transport system fused ATPase/permease subunit
MTDPAMEHTTAEMLSVADGSRVRTVVGALLRRHRGRTAAVVVLFLAAAALGVVMPACLGRIVDAVASDAGLSVVSGWVAAAAVGAVGAVAVTLWATRVLTSLVQDLLAELRENVFASAMRLPVSTIDDGERADLLSRVTGDVDAVAEAGGNVAPTLLSAGFAIGVSAVALAAVDPWLALAGLASAPCYVLGTRAFLRRSRVVFRTVRIREASRSQAVLDAVDGAETLAAFAGTDHALERVRERAAASIDAQIEGVRVANRLFRWINSGELVGLSAILATGFFLNLQGTITVGLVTTAALLFHRLFDPVGRLIFGLDDIQRATVGLARLIGVIDLAASSTTPESPSPVGGVADGVDAAPGIRVRDLTFRYPTTDRGIAEVTIDVPPGTTTALVGTSGSGKSTLARVVAGHHPPTSGRVLVGHTPYYLSQDLHHFRGSIADNLRLGAPDAGRDEMVSALRAVGAEWAVTALQDDPAAGPTGSRPAPVPLDEGRIQQLAVARAFLADPAIVILDEATADVGLHHRDAVEAAIAVLRTDRTALLIAHRLEQAATADRIAVFADGRIVQHGTHADLLASPGPYRESWLAHSPHPTQHTEPTREAETP